MVLLRLILVVAVTCVMLAESRPRYVLIPLQDMPRVRHTRSIPQYQHAPSSQYEEYLPVNVVEEYAEQVPQASDSYHHADPYGHNDHVDYGAYTGGYGAFGWYTDHPVCINCGHYH